ncbi:alpha/beta fold hydrolase [Antrihabitans sp. NCIMB 15449]|uniref:Alpha/beta fold hydrolase n=1 Tax=Antrihabitans spumae TaxID=3373370 RepID=A0ABW7JME7_9NOCA|nr:alpha/beta fold hydrolase [Rhodococcus opacus]
MTAAEPNQPGLVATGRIAVEEHVSIWGDLAGVDLVQRTVDVDGVATRVVEAGSGPSLILVHGTGGHLEAYARNVRDLAKDFHLVLYDMPGHGYSDKPDRPYTIDYLSDHLVALMDALSIDRADLSGESLGGWVAAWTAAHHPTRVRGMVLNTPGNITNKPEVMAGLKESSMKAVREANPQTVRARVEWLFHDTSLVTDELVGLRLRIYSQSGFETAMANILAVQDWEYRRPFVWSPTWCDRILAPTLLLWTDHDPTAAVEEASLLETLISGSRLEVIEGAGHWPQWEKPDEFNEAHIRFLKGKS